MTVYVDDSKLEWRGQLWCHMVADSLQELHHFAAKLGLRRSWFQDKTAYPHYDITLKLRNKAIRLGARMGDKQTIVSCAKELRVQLVAAAAECTSQADFVYV